MAAVLDVAPGLWVWRLGHPDWKPELDWPQEVTSTCVESGGEIAVLDPLAPPDDAVEVWARLDARPPTMAVILKPDHVRDATERQSTTGSPTSARSSCRRSAVTMTPRRRAAFPNDLAEKTVLKLVDTQVFDSGVAVSTYRPAREAGGARRPSTSRRRAPRPARCV